MFILQIQQQQKMKWKEKQQQQQPSKSPEEYAESIVALLQVRTLVYEDEDTISTGDVSLFFSGEHHPP